MQDQQTAEFFIGRTRERNLFMHWLNNPGAPWILYLHDSAERPEKRGGVGKTRLLRKYAEIVEQRYKDVQVVMIDFFNIADRDGITIAERVVAGLQTLHPEWSPTLFTEILSEYRNLSRTEGIDTTDMRQNALANALAEDLRQLDSTLVQKGKQLLVFFDTFEVVEQNPVPTVLRDGQTFPDNYQFKRLRAVVAGRNQLDWTHPNWQGRGNEVQSVALDPFSPEEMQRYIEREAVQEILQWNEKTEPLYICCHAA